MPRRLNIKTLEFVPYGVVEDGSAERARYARHLQGYLAATLLPVFAAWDGELPEHLQKARPAALAGPRAWPCCLLAARPAVIGLHAAQGLQYA